VLGPKGYDFLQSIADGMRNDEAKRLLGIIQLNMTDLDPQQSDRLRMLLKDQIVTIPLDDTDLFRPTDEWAGVVQERQAKVLEAAAGFLTPAQMDSLRTMTAIDLAQRQKDASRKRKLLGIQ
jgi:hypothetical protein